MSRLARDGTGLSNPSRETKFSGVNGDREIFIFPDQLPRAGLATLPGYMHTYLRYQKLVWKKKDAH